MQNRIHRLPFIGKTQNCNGYDFQGKIFANFVVDELKPEPRTKKFEINQLDCTASNKYSQ